MKIEDFQIGQIIYGKPTGNAARRKAELQEFEVIKVGRKYVTLKDGLSEDKYDPSSGATESEIRSGYGGNSGFLFFPSMSEFRKWEFRQTLILNIVSIGGGIGLRRKLEKLSDKDLKSLEHILLKADE